MRSLKITGGSPRFDIYLNYDIVPSFRSLDTDGSEMPNIGEFETMNKLILSNSNMIIGKLNDLNITELRLIDVDCYIHCLNIPYLRSLEIRGGYVDTRILNEHKLAELRLSNVGLDGNNPMFNIPTLRS